LQYDGCMLIQIRFFAAIREAVGTSALSLQTEATTVGGLRDELIARGGAWAEALARGRAVRASLNQAMVDEAAVLQDGCEVGFFPPVTGG
jgi:sulfur-carrier protein